MYDNEGEYTTVSSFTPDTAPPTVTVKRTPTRCKVTATDTVSGLWKIEQIDSSDNVVNTTEFSPLYTTSSASKLITLNNNAVKIKVYDAVNNFTSVDLSDIEIEYPMQLSENTIISNSILNGIKITNDCTLTFNNTNSISIGSEDSESPGIEVANGANLTIINDGSATVTIRGGYGLDSYGSTINYAGIYVPEDSTLNIQGSGTTYAYGCGQSNGTGAGIGGGGVYSKAGNNVGGGSVASATFTGSGTVIVKGGFGSGESKATGAHIGGGGVYTENNATNVTVGELSNLRVSDNASINTFSLG